MGGETSWIWWTNTVKSWSIKRKSRIISSQEYSRWRKERRCSSRSFRLRRASRLRPTDPLRAWSKLAITIILNVMNWKRRSKRICCQVWLELPRVWDREQELIAKVARVVQVFIWIRECKTLGRPRLELYLSHNRSRSYRRRNHQWMLGQVWVPTSRQLLQNSTVAMKYLTPTHQIQLKIHNLPAAPNNRLQA